MNKRSKMKSTLDNLFSSKRGKQEEENEAISQPIANSDTENKAVPNKPKMIEPEPVAPSVSVTAPIKQVDTVAATNSVGSNDKSMVYQTGELTKIVSNTPDPSPVAEIEVATPLQTAIPPKPVVEMDIKPAPEIQFTISKPAEEEENLVVFALENEFFGISIDVVEGIIKMQAITFVPNIADFIQGVTNLRGTVLPVINLRKRFHLPDQEPTQNTRIITINTLGSKNGIIVDAVSEVLRIPHSRIEPPPPMATTIETAFITGVAKHGDKLVILLDMAKILSNEEVTD